MKQSLIFRLGKYSFGIVKPITLFHCLSTSKQETSSHASSKLLRAVLRFRLRYAALRLYRVAIGQPYRGIISVLTLPCRQAHGSSNDIYFAGNARMIAVAQRCLRTEMALLDVTCCEFGTEHRASAVLR
jgi:hypothetical protein